MQLNLLLVQQQFLLLLEDQPDVLSVLKVADVPGLLLVLQILLFLLVLLGQVSLEGQDLLLHLALHSALLGILSPCR